MTLLSEVNGWSPVVHSMAGQEGLGLVTAAVFGAVWRYCQMENRVCNASLETIGEDLGIDKATVLRHIKKLCKKGFLRDETPNLRNVPHTYSDTGQAQIAGSIEAKTVAQDNSLPKTVVVRNSSRAKTVAQDNSLPKTVAHSNATVAESQLNRVFKRDSKRGGESPPNFEMKTKALTAYTKTTKLKLDDTQAEAIVTLIDESPEFDLARWQRACVTTKLAGVLAPNVQCRIDTYLAGGDYQAMRDRNRNGSPTGPPPPPAPLDAAKRAAFQALQAEHRAATAETRRRVDELVETKLKPEEDPSGP